jgi:hypothetical protein
MRQIAKASLLFFLIAFVTSFVVAGFVVAGFSQRYSTAKKEYFTEDELDLIRDAQELRYRVPTYFKLAERRLIFLGLKQQSDKEKEKEKKEEERRLKDAQKAGDAPANKKLPEDPLAYLDDFTRSELLRGYGQAIDEVMSNIDDSYGRKLDVRDALEDLEKFLRETMPLIEKFQAKNDSERAAMKDALDKANEAMNGTKEALGIVPKTEKKRKP